MEIVLFICGIVVLPSFAVLAIFWARCNQWLKPFHPVVTVRYASTTLSAQSGIGVLDSLRPGGNVFF